MPNYSYSEHDVQRFWSKVDRSGTCWVWLGSLTGSGYGQFSLNCQAVLAHKFSYLLAHGPSKQFWKMEVCHTCDNPSCVRPKHLVLGTHAYNLHDASQKGRFARILTWDDVRTMRAAAGVLQQDWTGRWRYSVSIRSLAHTYGVDDTVVQQILRHQLWKE
jgi:hypothetical protein